MPVPVGARDNKPLTPSTALPGNPPNTPVLLNCSCVGLPPGVPPPPPAEVREMLLPTTVKVTVALFIKLGLFTTDPLTFMEAPPPPTAVSINTKSSATIGSHPFKLKPRFGVIGSELPE
jgi:hypothetical protein